MKSELGMISFILPWQSGYKTGNGTMLGDSRVAASSSEHRKGRHSAGKEAPTGAAPDSAQPLSLVDASDRRVQEVSVRGLWGLFPGQLLPIFSSTDFSVGIVPPGQSD